MGKRPSLFHKSLIVILCFQVSTITLGPTAYADEPNQNRVRPLPKQETDDKKKEAYDPEADPLRQQEMRNWFSYVQDFAKDAYNEPLTYGLSAVAIGVSVFLAYRLSRSGDLLSAAKAQLAASKALKGTSAWTAYSAEVSRLESAVLRYEQGLRMADDVAFAEWAKTADAKYVKYVKKLRKQPPKPGALVPRNLFNPSTGGARPTINFERLHSELDDALGKTHSASSNLEREAARAGIGLKSLKSPRQMLSQGARLSRRMANPRAILNEAKAFRGPAQVAELNALRLMGKDLVLKRGVKHWPGNGWKLTKRGVWKMRYIILIGATAGFVYYLHKRQNAMDKAAVEAAHANETIRMDAEAQARREFTFNTNALVLMIQFQWEKLKQDYKEEFPFECPFDFTNKGHQDLVSTIFSKAIHVVSTELNGDVYSKEGQLSLDVYREFWKQTFNAARELDDEFRAGPTLEALLGENLDGKGGLADTLAQRSGNSFKEAMDHIDQFNTICKTLKTIGTTEGQKQRLQKILDEQRKLIQQGKVDPDKRLTETHITLIEKCAGLKDE